VDITCSVPFFKWSYLADNQMSVIISAEAAYLFLSWGWIVYICWQWTSLHIRRTHNYISLSIPGISLC